MSTYSTSRAMQFIEESAIMLFLNPFSLLALILFVFSLYKQLSKSTKTAAKTLPPSPPSMPFIGNLHQLGNYPYRSLQTLSQRYGDLMLLYLGNRPTLFVSSAEAAEEILKAHDVVFSSRPNLGLFRKFFYDCKDIVFSPYGEYWRQIRSVCVLRLLSNKKVQSFRETRKQEITLMMESIKRSEVVNLSEMFISLTKDIICRVAFGKKYTGEGGSIDFEKLLEEISLILGSFKMGDYIPWLSWIDQVSGVNGKAEKISKTFDEFLEKVIQEHSDLARETKEGDRDGNKDLVDVLLEAEKDNTEGLIGRDSIKAIILDIFTAGTDTGYIALEWTMTEILRHPRVMRKLQQEVRGIMGEKEEVAEDDLDGMTYLKAVIKEGFRLHPPLPLLLPRECTQDVRIQGYDIAANTQVITNVWAIGRDPRYWNDPESFYPERFMGSPIDYKGQHFQLLPFGAGRRGCPGISFAIVNIELVLANLVHQFDWELPNGLEPETLDITEVSGMSSHKKIPLCAVPTPRPNSHI